MKCVNCEGRVLAIEYNTGDIPHRDDVDTVYGPGVAWVRLIQCYEQTLSGCSAENMSGEDIHLSTKTGSPRNRKPAHLSKPIISMGAVKGERVMTDSLDHERGVKSRKRENMSVSTIQRVWTADIPKATLGGAITRLGNRIVGGLKKGVI